MKKDYIKDYEKKEYFSQNREDLIINAFFPEVKNGYYIDVGGFDPDYDSVTKYFYKRGWRGVNIEPQPRRYQAFVRRRTRDINVQAGVSDKRGEATLRIYRSGGLSTLSKKLQADYRSHPTDDVEQYDDVTVKVRTLSDILDEVNPPETIHFMKIDVEGLEYKVLAGNNWQKYRPIVICIEANHVEKDWRPILEKEGYVKVFFDGLNDYYCLENSHEHRVFDYVEYVVNQKGGGIHQFDLSKIREMESIIEGYAKQYKLDVAKVKRLEVQNRQKQDILNNPRAMIWRGVKSLIGRPLK